MKVVLIFFKWFINKYPKVAFGYLNFKVMDLKFLNSKYINIKVYLINF